jgi:ribosomal protein L32
LLGVGVYFEKENIDTATMSGEMMTALFAAFAQSESESISSNIRWGIQKRMQAGTFLSSSVPYGYRLKGRELKIEPAEGMVVCEIFNAYLAGINRNKIAEELNKCKVPTRSGKAWHRSAVTYILTNERYIGDSLWQKTYATNTLPTKQVKNGGERAQYYAKKTNPAIIDEEIFRAVQKLVRERRKAPKQRELSCDETFRQKIVCADCGTKWRRKVTRSTVYWVCPKHEENINKCSIKQIPEQEIQTAFLRLYYKLKCHREEILTPMLNSLRTIRNRRMLWSVDIIELNKQICDLSSQNQMMTELKKQGLIDPDIFIAQTNELSEQLRSAKLKKEKLLDADEDKTLAQTQEIIDILETGPEFLDSFNAELFGELVNRVIVDSNEQLQFELKNGLKLPESIERTVR